jgi:pimeloyl-ACP methyl ester carboxylesterase
MPNLAWNEATAFLVLGAALLAASLLGRSLLKICFLLMKRYDSRPEHDPRREAVPEDMVILPRPDGSILHLATYGQGPSHTVIACDGWGCSSAQWNRFIRGMSDRPRVVVWDAPGLGHSTPPKNNDYDPRNIAANLAEIIHVRGGSQRCSWGIASAV